MFSHREGVSNLTLGSALDCYASWPSPVAIISDGAYGINGFDGDWEPFGGLCTASFAAARLGRDSYAAEITKSVYDVASARLGRPSDLTYGPSVLDLFGI